MSNLRTICLSLAWVAVGFLIPACLSSWGAYSTPFQEHGWPVFVHLELTPVFEDTKFYRIFESLTITPGLYFYMLVPLVGGFIAGRVWPRRRPGA